MTAWTSHLAVGFTATGCAAAASLLADSVTAKRVVWLAVCLAVGIAAGVWRGLRNKEEAS